MSEIPEKIRAVLLDIARDSIKSEVEGKAAMRYDNDDAFEPIEASGVFVTIKNKGELRGCIGHIHQEVLTVETLKEVAASAAANDPRFNSVIEDELNDIDIEITVLTPFKKIGSTDEIEVGKHGLFVKCGYNQGLLLPQVATENNFTKTEFLEHTCLKAGLSMDAWKEDKTDIFIFSGEVFGERTDN